MADLEAVLADVSYLMAMEKSKCTPAARASKKIVLPDPRYIFPPPPPPPPVALAFAFAISRGSIRSTTARSLARPSVRPSVRRISPRFLPLPSSFAYFRRSPVDVSPSTSSSLPRNRRGRNRPVIRRIGGSSLEVTGENCLQTAAGVALLGRFERSRRRLKPPMHRLRPPSCSISAPRSTRS